MIEKKVKPGKGEKVKFEGPQVKIKLKVKFKDQKRSPDKDKK